MRDRILRYGLGVSAAVLIVASLGACTQDQLATAQTDIANAKATAAVVLTETAAAACDAQKAANAAADLATATHNADTAAGAAAASALLGKGCTWTVAAS